MRPVSASLEAAQTSASSLPYVKAVFSDHAGDRPRLRFERLYEGSETPWRHAVCGAGDGSLVRARIDQTAALLYVQRVANPGPASDFSSWSSLGSVAAASVALCCAEGSATVRLFYVDADGTTLRMRVSTDTARRGARPRW